jgi:heat shock 70kDa protein 4
LLLQDWLYDEGEDTTKAVYIAKIDEIRALAGPIAQRYFDKLEEERQAAQAKLDAELAAKREAAEAAKKAEKPAEEPVSKEEDMTDADTPIVEDVE